MNKKIKGSKDSSQLMEEFNDILNTPAKSTQRTGDKRTYKDLAVGRFALNQVVRIERTDDPHTISNKWFDFSYSTISQLIQQGIDDALKTLVDDVKKSKDNQAADNQLNKFINEVKKEEQNGELPANRAIQLRKLAETFKAV